MKMHKSDNINNNYNDDDNYHHNINVLVYTNNVIHNIRSVYTRYTYTQIDNNL